MRNHTEILEEIKSLVVDKHDPEMAFHIVCRRHQIFGEERKVLWETVSSTRVRELSSVWYCREKDKFDVAMLRLPPRDRNDAE